MRQKIENGKTSPVIRICIAASLLALCFAFSTTAELTTKPATEQEFSGIEYKILLDIKGLSAAEPIETTLGKIAAALDGIFDVGRSAGNRNVMYLDSADGKLDKNHYLLRVFPNESDPADSKLTLRGRWDDISQAQKLQGAGFNVSKCDIDYSGGKGIHSVSYNISMDQTAEFPEGKLTGEAVRKNIAKRYPDLGKFIDSIMGSSEMIVPGIAVSYGTSATLKEGQLTSGKKKSMGLDIYYCGKERVFVEISYGAGSAKDKQALAVYEEVTALLKKKGVLAEKQMTKTQCYFDAFLGGKAAGEAKSKQSPAEPKTGK